MFAPDLPSALLGLSLTFSLSNPPAAPASGADPLAERLLAKISFTGSVEQEKFFEKLTYRVLESPTARGLAAKFVAENGDVSARFAVLPNTELYERRDGRTSFTAPKAGYAERREDGASIVLNEACLRIDPEYAGIDCARQYAHEFFGHTLGWLEAGRHGLRSVYLYYDDEHFARLVGWLVTLELSGRLTDPEAACATQDGSSYQRYLQRIYPTSTAGFTAAELADPETALRTHLNSTNLPEARAAGEKAAADFAGAWGQENLPKFRAAAAQPFFREVEERTHTYSVLLRDQPEKLFTPEAR